MSRGVLPSGTEIELKQPLSFFTVTVILTPEPDSEGAFLRKIREMKGTTIGLTPAGNEIMLCWEDAGRR